MSLSAEPGNNHREKHNREFVVQLRSDNTPVTIKPTVDMSAWNWCRFEYSVGPRGLDFDLSVPKMGHQLHTRRRIFIQHLKFLQS